MQSDKFAYVVYSAKDNSELARGEGELNPKLSLLENMTKIASVVNREASLSVYRRDADDAAMCDY